MDRVQGDGRKSGGSRLKGAVKTDTYRIKDEKKIKKRLYKGQEKVGLYVKVLKR